MNSRAKKLILAGAAVAALGVGGTAIAGNVGSDENGGAGDDGPGSPVTGAALDRASRVAIDRVGGGDVTGSELQDEEGYYEIEVTRDDYPDRIVLYQDTLERDFGHDSDLLRAQVERTLRHELAHHLGWRERGVRDLGL